MLAIAVDALLAVAVIAGGLVLLAVFYPLLWMAFHGILMIVGVEKKDDVIC